MNALPKKKFGQHFLTDTHTIAKIIDRLAVRDNDLILEIGPGRGALTATLHEKLSQLWAVELDRDLAPKLAERFPKLTLFNTDGLTFDYLSWAQALKNTPQQRIRLVGNLPYNVAMPLLFRFIHAIDHWHDLSIMVQKEVADRMMAQVNHPAYGRLSVMCHFYFQQKKLLDVRPGAFFPAPKVMSSIIRLVPKPPALRQQCHPDIIAMVVKAAFAMRRKKISNTLRGLFPLTTLQAMGIADLRAENLTLDQYITLAKHHIPT